MPKGPRRAGKKSKPGARRVSRSRPAQRATAVRKKRPAALSQSKGTAPAQAPVSPAVPKLRVRMYRQGLGDCFLLTFNPGGDEKHVLIDCGTLGATSTKVTLPDVIADIDKATNGHLHLVVATHQHQDHLSGFPKLSAQFSPANKKQIDHVWLAWTEDPNDTLAKQLGKARDDMAIAVKSAAQAMRATGGDTERANAVDSLLGFFGDTAVVPGASGQADGATFAAAAKNSIDCVRGLVKQAEYRTPGEPVIELDWLPGFRFYVLGPPRDIDAIHDTGEHGSSELYALTAMTRAALQQADAGKPAAGADDAASEAPFDQRFRLARTNPRIVEVFGKTYLHPSQSWRSVDTDWLSGASGLAIQLDKFTNNTSLVIAIERIADGKVLLFPGDAQEGNWLSWQGPSITWQVNTPDGKTATVTAKDLLSRTVFYKVGHHSSHNATAKAKGLEMMTSQSQLTAFIPVDRQVALGRSPAGTWKMPARQLYRALLDKCQGRVVRSDVGWASNVKLGTRGTESEFAGLGTDAEWAAWIRSQQSATAVQIEADHIDFLLE
jgi:metallo-beta-lactamase superfamily protein